MFKYLDFVYTKDGKFGMVLAFNQTMHKYKIVFDFGKSTENSDYYYKEDLKVVI